jgi:hypothetical protein
MADIGTVAQKINAKKFQVYIGSTSNEWKLLQNARVLISHPVFREPTTSGGVVTYTGAPDHSISGSLIFTRDSWDNGTANDFKSLLTVDSSTGEVPENDWLIKLTDSTGTATNTTFTFSGCKVSVIDISKSVEGGTKVDITVVCPQEPTSA